MIAVVVPTIRPESYKKFLEGWDDLFKKHSVKLVTVWDGDNPIVEYQALKEPVKEVMGEYSDLIYNHNDGVRNLGFAMVAKAIKDADVIISLDDDVLPVGDTIQDHLDALERRVSVTWLPTASQYTRGFPYNTRTEAEVVLSHGVWEGVADWDSPTQLVRGNRKIESFYIGAIPWGVLYPHCSMNFAFKRKLLPYVYQAPMFNSLNRFADIWGGIECKKKIDEHNPSWAVVSGYARVNHTRASNVFENLTKEIKGLTMNEEYGKGAYFELFKIKRERWEEWIKKNCGNI